MNRSTYTIVLLVMGLLSFTSSPNNDVIKVKCLVQLTNYQGEGAYCTVSLLDGDGNYRQTLQVLGEDDAWYPDIEEWFAFHDSDKGNSIDGITGASISVGKRALFTIDLPASIVSQGYALRFESAVEDLEYHPQDVVVPIDNEKLEGKYKGSGYIRYVRLLPAR